MRFAPCTPCNRSEEFYHYTFMINILGSSLIVASYVYYSLKLRTYYTHTCEIQFSGCVFKDGRRIILKFFNISRIFLNVDC